VVGWYLPVLIVVEEQMKSGGVRVVVMMKRVAVGRTAGGIDQAVGIRSRREWQRHKMSRGQLVGITGQSVQADGGREVLVVGQELSEEWTEHTVEETEWRRKAKRQWKEMEQATVRREWCKDLERDKVYDRG
jgi:hypothetical protein